MKAIVCSPNDVEYSRSNGHNFNKYAKSTTIIWANHGIHVFGKHHFRGNSFFQETIY